MREGKPLSRSFQDLLNSRIAHSCLRVSVIRVIGQDALAILLIGRSQVSVFAAKRGERLPRRDALDLCAQKSLGNARVAFKADLPDGQMWAIDNCKADADCRVHLCLSLNLDGSVGMTQLVQSGLNGEGHPIKRRGIGWFTEPRRELVLFQQFLDLALRKQTGAGVLEAGKDRLFLEMKNESHTLLWQEALKGGDGSRGFFNANGLEPAKSRERAKIMLQFCGIERLAWTQGELRGDGRG